MQKGRLYGSGMDSIRLLVNDESAPAFTAVVNQPLPLRQQFRRRIYFILSAQSGIVSVVSLLFFLLFGARTFVQQHAYILPITISGLVAALVLLKVFFFKTLVNGILFLAVNLIGTLVVTAFTLYYDSEIGYQIPFLVCLVCFSHGLFCLQSLRDLSWPISLFITVSFSGLGCVMLQVLLALFEIDYLTNISVTFVITLYIHLNIQYFSTKITNTEVSYALMLIFTALLPPYKYKNRLQPGY